MVSTETLRKFPFFSLLSANQLVELAMIMDEYELGDGAAIFSEGDRADKLFFLLGGCVDVFYTVQDNFHPSLRKEVAVCQVNPGEPFGISALIEPHVLTASARCCGPSLVMEIDREQLETVLANDPQLEILFMRRMAQAAIERLHTTRIQLAAAYS